MNPVSLASKPTLQQTYYIKNEWKLKETFYSHKYLYVFTHLVQEKDANTTKHEDHVYTLTTSTVFLILVGLTEL